jgi:hypothetical protein
MKLIFFLIAFCLMSIRVYFSWSGKDREKRGVSESNMVIKSDNFYEEIKYSGKFQLTEDETGFKSISPGGYFKFIKNDEKVKAESNLKGEIEYTLYDGKNSLSIQTEQGKKLLAEAVKEMVYQGFDASARMERIYQKGGIPVLLSEMDSMKIAPLKILYLNRLFAVDSLSPVDMTLIFKKVESLGSDMDKSLFLNKISSTQFKNPQIAEAYFAVVKGMRSDMDKANALHHIIDQDSSNSTYTANILTLSGDLRSETDKADLFGDLIKKGLINGLLFDSLLDLVSNMGSEMDKTNLYKKLLTISPISENQWIHLVSKTAILGSDIDKANLLVDIAQKMPKTEPVKAAFLKAAKSIGNDSDYGKVVRALE